MVNPFDWLARAIPARSLGPDDDPELARLVYVLQLHPGGLHTATLAEAIGVPVRRGYSLVRVAMAKGLVYRDTPVSGPKRGNRPAVIRLRVR